MEVSNSTITWGFIIILFIAFLIGVSKGNYSTSTSNYSGYTCTDDCSGHEAGRQWAIDNGITDPDSCGGKSQSFIEGCRVGAGY